MRANRRHDRRALSADEFTRLIKAARAGKTVESLSGPDRAMLYIVAAWTGFRKGEVVTVQLRAGRADCHLLLRFHVYAFPLSSDEGIESFTLFDGFPKQVGHLDCVDIRTRLGESRRQQSSLAPKLPLIVPIVPEDRKGQIVIDRDSRRHGIQILFEEFNAVFQ